MTFTASAGVGVRASDGKLMFRYQNAANGTANVATPIYSNNKVFFSSGYGAGGGVIDLSAQNGEVAAKEVYHTRNMRNHHGGVVLVDGFLYGFNDGILTCLEFATGKLMWRDRSVGKGVGHVRGRPSVHSERGQRGGAGGGDTGWLSGEGTFHHSRQRTTRAGRTRRSVTGACTCAIRIRCSCTNHSRRTLTTAEPPSAPPSRRRHVRRYDGQPTHLATPTPQRS